MISRRRSWPRYETAAAELERLRRLNLKHEGTVELREADDDIYHRCGEGRLDEVRAYLEAAEENGTLQRVLNERGSSRGRALLHVAALAGANDVINLLVYDFGANVGIRSLLGRDTPLHLAAQEGHRHTCFLLVQSGADADVKNKFGETPLHYATKLSVIRLLLRHGARVTEEDSRGRTPLQAAEENGAPEPSIKELHAKRR